MKKRLLGLMAFLFAITAGWAQTDGLTDITSTYLTNADMSASSGGWTFVDRTDDGPSQGHKLFGFYSGWGSIERTGGSMSQEFLAELPAGDYRLTAYSFFRQGLTYSVDPTKSLGKIILSGIAEVTVPTLGSIEGLSVYANDFPQATEAFYTNNYYLNTIDFTITEAQRPTLSFECTFDLKQSWFLVGEVKLYQVALDAFIADYETAYSKVENLEAATLNTAMNDKIQAVLTETKDVAQTKDELQAATAKLNAVYDEAVAMQAAMSKVLDAINSCYDLMDNASNTGDVETLEAAIQKANSDIDAAEDATAADAIVAELNAAKMAYIPTIELGEGETLDMSWLVVNPGFDTNLNGWTSEGGAQNKARATNKTNGIITDGFYENWNPSAFTGTIYQVISGLPNGKYKVKVAAFGNGAHVFANDSQVQITSEEGLWYEVETMVSDGTLKFGIVNNNNTGWMGIDNASIAFAGTVDLSELQATLAEKLVEAEAITETAMNAETLATLTTAITNAQNVAETEEALTTALADLSSAVTAANASIADYAALKVALDKAAEILASTNVYVEADKVAYETVYNEAKAAYEAGTYVADDAVTINKLWNTGWQDGNLLARPFISSVWADDDAVYTNNWSTEADNKANGSGVTAPFVEYWTGDANSLGAKTIDAVVENLPAGTYQVTGLARVRIKNGQASATGVTFTANDATVDIAANGKTCDDGTPFRFVALSELATVGEDGTLTLAFNVAAENTCSWLAFKNITYRALTDEEVAEIEKEKAEAEAAAKLAAAKAQLYAAGNKIATLNAIIGDDACTTLLEEAQVLYENEEATLEEVTAKTTEVYNSLSSYTNEALFNGSFEYELDSWTEVKEGDYAYSGVAAYGSETAVNSVVAPATDMIGGEGYALGLSCAWGNKMSYTQEVTLAAGKYVLSYEAYNSNPTATIATNLTGVTVGETTYASTLTSYNGSEWTNDAIQFEVAEKGTVTVTVGYVSNNIGSGSTAKLWYDNVTISTVELAPLPPTTYDFIPSETTPAEGGTAVGMSMFSMMFNDYVNINYENSSSVNVYDAATDEVAATGTLTPNWMARGMGLNVVFDAPLAAGSYYITFAQGLFGDNDWYESGYTSGKANPELTYNFTAEELVVNKVPTTFTPADGATVASITQFEITFEHRFDRSYATTENPVVLDAEGNVVEEIVGGQVEWNDDWTVMILKLNTEITTPGTYTFKMPAEYISLMDDGYNPIGTTDEITSTIVIAAPKVPTNLDPANGSEVGMLMSFEAKFDFSIEKNWYATDMPYVKNGAGETIYTLESWQATLNDTWDGFVFTMPETIMTPDTYTIVVPAGVIAEADAEGNPTGAYNDEFEVTYIVTGEVAPVTYDFTPVEVDPADGSTVSQLYSFTLMFNEAPQVNYEVANPVTVYNEDGDAISTGTIFGSRMQPNAVTVTCSDGESITANGTYTIIINQGAFGNELWLNSGAMTGACNPELQYTFTVVEPDLAPTAIVPDNNTTIEKLDSIILTYNFAVGLSWYGNVTVKDAEGNEVASVDGEACELVPESEDANWWDPCYTVKIKFTEPIETKGTYTVTLPEGFLMLGEAGEFQNKETIFTYEVTGGDGINSIAAEDGNVTVYTLNGVKVLDNQPANELKNLKKGIYIVNGKKVVIK